MLYFCTVPCTMYILYPFTHIVNTVWMYRQRVGKNPVSPGLSHSPPPVQGHCMTVFNYLNNYPHRLLFWCIHLHHLQPQPPDISEILQIIQRSLEKKYLEYSRFFKLLWRKKYLEYSRYIFYKWHSLLSGVLQI